VFCDVETSDGSDCRVVLVWKGTWMPESDWSRAR
jgi:hypothetical protein